jgi:hypothetical protein
MRDEWKLMEKLFHSDMDDEPFSSSKKKGNKHTDDRDLSLSPLSKKQKLRDISHLQKRYKGPPVSKKVNKKRRGGPKRPLGKMNDPKEDLIYVSDGDMDGDDF